MSKVTHINGSTKSKTKKKAKPLRQDKIDAREELFCEVLATLEDYDLREVAEAAEVSYSTLWQWCFGDTSSPLLNNLIKVARALHCEVQLVDLSQSQSGKLKIAS